LTWAFFVVGPSYGRFQGITEASRWILEARHASVLTRKHKSGEQTYKVQCLLRGRRGAPWQSETFTDRRAALEFVALVDAGGQRWPDGWVKRVGFGEVSDEPAGSTRCASSPPRTSAG